MPSLRQSWEKGLSYVEQGNLTRDEYMVKLEDFVKRMVENEGTQQQCCAEQYFPVRWLTSTSVTRPFWHWLLSRI